MNITAQQLRDRKDAGESLIIIDVREDWEYQEDNIGAIHIPLGSLADRLDELEQYKDQEVIVHCRSGARSRAAQVFLQQSGFVNVLNLDGGILAYRQL